MRTGATEEPSGNGVLPPLAGAAAALLGIAFGGNAVAIKLTLEGLGPFTTAGLRFAIAAVAITAWAAATGRRLRLRPGQLRVIAGLGVVFSAQMALFYLGMDRTLASRGMLLGNLQPFLVLLLAHSLLPDDRITLPKLAGVMLGLLGVAVIFAGGSTLTDRMLGGDILVIGSVVLWAATTIYMKRILDGFEAFHLALFPMYVQAPILVAAGLLLDPPAGPLTAGVWGGLLYQGLLTAGVGFVAWTVLLKRYGAVALNAYQFVVPVSGVALSWAVLGEHVAAAEMTVATALIAAGIALANRPARARGRA